MPGKYEFGYVAGSAHERLVKLVQSHADPGLVLDLGCGYGASAEPLSDAGYQYVGLDFDKAALESLAERGFETAQVDLRDAAGTIEAMSSVAAGRRVCAVGLLDCVEHLVDPDALLGPLAEWAKGADDPLVVVSIPNVSHRDIGARLLSGHWDITETGLLDSTHVSWFTQSRVEDTFAGYGWHQVDADDVVMEHSEQAELPGHPFYGPGARVELALKRLRQIADPYGETYQFVRCYRMAAARATRRPLVPALSVIVRVETDDDPSRLLRMLAEQDTDDFEVVVVGVGGEAVGGSDELRSRFGERLRVLGGSSPTAGEATNAGLAWVLGHYVALLDSNAEIASSWARRFVEGSRQHRGRVLRVGTFAGGHGENAEPIHEPIFTLADQLASNRFLPGTAAVPATLCHQGGVWSVAGAAADSDWVFLTKAAAVAGVVDIPYVTVGRRAGGGAGASLREELETFPLVFFRGTEVVEMLDARGQDQAELDGLRQRVAVLETERDAARNAHEEILQSEFWRATLPLRRAVIMARQVGHRFR